MIILKEVLYAILHYGDNFYTQKNTTFCKVDVQKVISH